MGVFISSEAAAREAAADLRDIVRETKDVSAGVSAHRNGFLQFLRREPMVHFLAAGALIFAATHFIGEYRDRSAHTIVVDAALRDRLQKLYALQLGSTPTDAQLTQLVDSYVHDEILYREGLALGLDKGDEIVRRRLIQKMGFLQSDLVIAEDPDDAALRSYYRDHAAQFAAPAKVGFEQRFFGGDAADSAASYQRAVRALALLNGGTRESDIGADRSPLAARYRELDRDDVVRLFGETPIVDEVLKGAVGAWRGPFQSGYGWHLMRVLERDEPQAPSFESARDTVAEAVRAQQKEDNNRASFAQLRARYDVQVQP